jgi:hypothetical protein
MDSGTPPTTNHSSDQKMGALLDSRGTEPQLQCKSLKSIICNDGREKDCLKVWQAKQENNESAGVPDDWMVFEIGKWHDSAESIPEPLIKWTRGFKGK